MFFCPGKEPFAPRPRTSSCLRAPSLGTLVRAPGHCILVWGSRGASPCSNVCPHPGGTWIVSFL